MSAVPIVYVVDDDPALRDSLAWLLESAGVDVMPIASAGEFLSAYDPARRGCLVLDVCMPGIGGLQLQQILSARGVRLPVIVVSAHADDGTRERAMKAGAVAFLEKPFDGRVLIDLVRGCLAGA